MPMFPSTPTACSSTCTSDALDSINHKSNHDQPWAYEGGRVDEEMRRMIQAMCGIICLKKSITHQNLIPLW